MKKEEPVSGPEIEAIGKWILQAQKVEDLKEDLMWKVSDSSHNEFSWACMTIVENTLQE